MAQWWGDAKATETSAMAQWVRSDMKSIPAARKLVKLKLIQLDPPGLTARGTEILGKLPAGLIEQRLCRGTGRRVSIYDSAEAGLSSEGADEKYTMVCEPHDMLTTTETLKLARFHAVVPEWCPVCSGQEEQPEENPEHPGYRVADRRGVKYDRRALKRVLKAAGAEVWEDTPPTPFMVKPHTYVVFKGISAIEAKAALGTLPQYTWSVLTQVYPHGVLEHPQGGLFDDDEDEDEDEDEDREENPKRPEPTPDQRRKFAQEAVLWMEEQWVEWTAKIDGGLFDAYRIDPDNRVMWSDITAQFPGLSSVLGREDYHAALLARQAELPWLDAVNRGHRKLKTGNIYGFKYPNWEAEVAAAERASRKRNPETHTDLVRKLKF